MAASTEHVVFSKVESILYIYKYHPGTFTDKLTSKYNLYEQALTKDNLNEQALTKDNLNEQALTEEFIRSKTAVSANL